MNSKLNKVSSDYGKLRKVSSELEKVSSKLGKMNRELHKFVKVKSGKIIDTFPNKATSDWSFIISLSEIFTTFSILVNNDKMLTCHMILVAMQTILAGNYIVS